MVKNPSPDPLFISHYAIIQGEMGLLPSSVPVGKQTNYAIFAILQPYLLTLPIDRSSYSRLLLSLFNFISIPVFFGVKNFWGSKFLGVNIFWGSTFFGV